MDWMKEKKEVLVEMVEELELCLCELEKRLNVKKFKVKRSDEVLEILKRGKLVSISEIGEEIGISNKNVSSVLCEIRDKGYEIVKIGRGFGKLKLIEK